MQKSIKYGNGIIVIHFNENPEAAVFPDEKHTMTLSVYKLIQEQMVSGFKLWDKKEINIFPGNEEDDIKTYIQTAIDIGQKFIDINYQESGSPVSRVLIAQGFNR